MAQTLLNRSLAALAAVSVPLAGSSWAAGPLQKLGKGEGQVDIVAWAGYIERGATDKNFDWVTDFEKKTGCKVNVKTAGTSDEMVALMNEGGFDLVTASGDASTRLIRGKSVQPINVGLIPSYKNVDPRLQKAPWHYENNTHYGVPYQWGWNVLMYNTTGLQGQAADLLERGVRGDRRCPTARATRAACRPSTGRSTSPTPRCT